MVLEYCWNDNWQVNPDFVILVHQQKPLIDFSPEYSALWNLTLSLGQIALMCTSSSSCCRSLGINHTVIDRSNFDYDFSQWSNDHACCLASWKQAKVCFFSFFLIWPFLLLSLYNFSYLLVLSFKSRNVQIKFDLQEPTWKKQICLEKNAINPFYHL